ncbi:hypothetical protein C8N32_10876 [Rhodovulum imhoffii]|uniref:Uncharacterized protein n=2 Tax=Rhodovulum imhoffii TaxID=365340 RepID=A0A2T5BS37_9RHOB|nr:hypothetical protein C8N32_10876 [Rhodovulum imhoffii]
MGTPMRRAALLLFALCSAPAVAEEPSRTCPLTDDSSNCARILACIGEQGRRFNGRAFGRGTGPWRGKRMTGLSAPAHG